MDIRIDHDLVFRANLSNLSVLPQNPLWGSPKDQIRELDLPVGKDALVLTIDKCEDPSVTLDGRVSPVDAVRWRYSGHQAI